jgi:hypothetical protein
MGDVIQFPTRHPLARAAEALWEEAMKPGYNPERRAWRGRSYKKGGENVRKLREEQPCNDAASGAESLESAESCGNAGSAPPASKT